MATDTYTFAYFVSGGTFIEFGSAPGHVTVAPPVTGFTYTLGESVTDPDGINSSTPIGGTIEDVDGTITGTDRFTSLGLDGPLTLFAVTEAGEPILETPTNGRWLFSDTETLFFSGVNVFDAAIPFTYCFGKGTQISTPQGEQSVEDLSIGDALLTAEGGLTQVRWIGTQTRPKMFAGPALQPVRIRMGALGPDCPHTDLVVTAEHGMIIDGMVINASALINGSTIDWVPMRELPKKVTYFHIETENHDIVFANGILAETFMDTATRRRFDNYQEYLDLYGAERIIPEMRKARITSQRLLPAAIKRRLGLRTPFQPYGMKAVT